jgi:hypothetical protein
MAESDIPISSLSYLMLTAQLSDCVRLCTQASRTATNADARLYLGVGLVRRILALVRCIEGIARIAPPDRNRPLQLDEQSELDLYLNSTFLHISGTMDNLALAFFYEFHIPRDETAGKPVPLSRIGLFKKAFLDQVSSLSTDLQALLHHMKEWNTFLESLRHPIAHRILLYAVPALLNDEQSAEHQRIQNLIFTNLNNGQPEKNENLWNEISQIGEYEPAFALNDPQGNTIFPISARLQIDVRNLVRVLRSVTAVFASKAET